MSKNFLFSVILTIFWTIIMAYITLAAVPLNPISMNFENKMNILSVVPEGWGFFTRNPREPALYMYYRKSPNSGYTLLNSPLSSPENGFGISRRMRKINIELFAILSTVKDSSWQRGNENAIDLSCDSTLSVKGIFDNSTLRGTFLLIKQERLPWAWARQRQQIIMPYKKIILDIK